MTITDVVFEGVETGFFSDGISVSSATRIRLEDFAVKNNKAEFRKNRTALNLLINLNKDFENYFSLNKVSTEDDD